MTNNRRNVLPLIPASAAVLLAYSCRMLAMFRIGGQSLSFVRALIYASLFAVQSAAWGRSVVQEQTRRYMVSAGILMVIWSFVRTVKYEFELPPVAIRLCWYLYYLPMLFIPLMGLFTALSIGRPDCRRRSPSRVTLWLITAGMLLLVLTTDLHQLVFTFPGDVPFSLRTDQNYGYGPLHFAIIGWMCICGLAALAVMLVKCKVPYSKKYFWLPLLPMGLMFAYTVIYYVGFPWLRFWLGDMPSVISLLFASVFEACLRCGLIASNTDYEALFRTVYAGMIITDSDYRIRYISDRALPLPERVLRQTESGSLRYGDSLLLKASPISGGHTIWQEDISALLSVKKALEATREELQERNDILRDQYRRDAQRYRLEEQNRLYDLVQQETQKQLRQIDELTGRYAQAAKCGEDTRTLLFRLLVLATYVKRHKDMVVLAERIPYMPMNALHSALRESCGNLKLGGIDCNLYLPQSSASLPIRAALSAYACFEATLEAALAQLHYLLVSVTRREGVPVLSMTLDCTADLSGIFSAFPYVQTERTEDGWIIAMPMTGGAEQ